MKVGIVFDPPLKQVAEKTFHGAKKFMTRLMKSIHLVITAVIFFVASVAVWVSATEPVVAIIMFACGVLAIAVAVYTTVKKTVINALAISTQRGHGATDGINTFVRINAFPVSKEHTFAIKEAHIEVFDGKRWKQEQCVFDKKCLITEHSPLMVSTFVKARGLEDVRLTYEDASGGVGYSYLELNINFHTDSHDDERYEIFNDTVEFKNPVNVRWPEILVANGKKWKNFAYSLNDAKIGQYEKWFKDRSRANNYGVIMDAAPTAIEKDAMEYVAPLSFYNLTRSYKEYDDTNQKSIDIPQNLKTVSEIEHHMRGGGYLKVEYFPEDTDFVAIRSFCHEVFCNNGADGYIGVFIKDFGAKTTPRLMGPVARKQNTR